MVCSFNPCSISLAIFLSDELALIRGLEQALLVLLGWLLLLLLSLEIYLSETLLEVLQVVVVCIAVMGGLRLSIANQLLAHIAKLHLRRGLDSTLATILISSLVYLTCSDVLLTEGMTMGLSSTRKECATESIRALCLLKYLARIACYRIRVDGESVGLRTDVCLVHSIVASLFRSWSFCCRGRIAFSNAERLIIMACSWIMRSELASFVRCGGCPAAVHSGHLTVRLDLLERAHV